MKVFEKIKSQSTQKAFQFHFEYNEKKFKRLIRSEPPSMYWKARGAIAKVSVNRLITKDDL